MVSRVGACLSDKVGIQRRLGPPGRLKTEFPAEASFGEIPQIPAELARNNFRIEMNGFLKDEIPGNFHQTWDKVVSFVRSVLQFSRTRGIQIGLGVIVDGNGDEIVAGNVQGLQPEFQTGRGHNLKLIFRQRKTSKRSEIADGRRQGR